ncbi:tubulin monoglycylase TTLL3 [Cololabis saira]|uniref:tubulin monoglycylase TTLL3 n=1 Tax=Cololabis saira TaxID=129043 RepID=UPI002AD490B3|nr:tubulin monoglycylase TTLL3 [Cololabis saira]
MPVLQSTVAPLEGGPHCSVSRLPPIKATDGLKAARAAVKKAVKLKKVFSVQGPYPVIRAALWARGWVERCLPSPVQRALRSHGYDEEEDGGGDGDSSADATGEATGFEGVGEGKKDENLDYMYDLMSRLVRNETTYFYWTCRTDQIDRLALQNDQMINHFANAGTFTTKVGLCKNLRQLRWFDAADPDNFFPRCYSLGEEEEQQAFIEDFRRTACTSLLQYVVETSAWRTDGAEGERQKDKDSAEDKLYGYQNQFVGPEIIDRALQVSQEFLSILRHCDIDVTEEACPSLGEEQWDEFLQDYYKVAHKGAVIRGSGAFVARCQDMLASLKEVCPQLDIDGLNNIWITKPGAKSRGRGIKCMNRLDKILALAKTDRFLMKWVVQKYMERPLLVHGTKFDIRQWFLVTDWNPLTVWFYKDCYLRFSSQPYSTKTLHRSVHLCNNSIQKHCQPSSSRHPGLPDDNMWSCSQFCSFLQRQGRKEEWASVVVPGMQKAVIHALQTAQGQVKQRKASFELYGADFMLGRDLKPWLLEINSSPTMSTSTAVTARLCPAVQLDTLRVVLDQKTGPKAYTGGFQLIYKQSAIEVPHYKALNLLLEGHALRQPKPLHCEKIPPVAVHTSYQQRPPEEVEKGYDPSSQKSRTVAARCHSGLENQERMIVMPTSPKREPNIRAEVKNAHNVRRFSHNLLRKRSLRVHHEPQAKVHQSGASAGVYRKTLVPRSISFSLGPPHNEPEGQSQFSAHSGSRISGSFLLQTTSEPQHETSTQFFPSIQGPLPNLDVGHQALLIPPFSKTKDMQRKEMYVWKAPNHF